MHCAIWYHLYNLKKKHEGALISAKACNLTKINIPHGCFLCLLNCTNGTKSRSASHITNETETSLIIVHQKLKAAKFFVKKEKQLKILPIYYEKSSK